MRAQGGHAQLGPQIIALGESVELNEDQAEASDMQEP